MRTNRQQTLLSEENRAGAELMGEWVWIGILTAASPLFTVVFTCATPFVAFATLAVMNMRWRTALILMGSVWFINQVAGFGCLGYPWTAGSFEWAVALGGASYIALLSARGMADYLRTTNTVVATAAAFSTAFFAFEAALFGVSYILPGGGSAFRWPVMEKIFAINVAAFLGLLLLHRAALWVGLVTPARIEQSARPVLA